MNIPQVRRRCVLYLSGFDPKGAAHYHTLYRTEALRQARVNGMIIDVGVRKRAATGNPTWTISAMDDGVSVHTDYEFLRWDDVVRKHWPRHPLILWRDVLTTTLYNMRTGALTRMRRLCWPPFVALFAPFALLCVLLLSVPLLTWGLFTLGQAAGAPVWLGGGMALAGVAALLVGARWAEARMNMLWLMRSYAFTLRQARGRTPDLEQRLDEHVRTLVERVRVGRYDEVLLVGHSSGTIMAANVLARALRAEPGLGRQGPAVNLLTLGQCMPMLGFLPPAKAFRDDLALLATADGIGWLDVAAPPDGCCFALCDPLLVLDTIPTARQADRPRMVSPRFVKMFAPEVYARIRRDKFRVHFQYLMAAELPTDYDYFRITAGSRFMFAPVGPVASASSSA